MGLSGETLLELARRKGPNASHRGKDLLRLAMELGDSDTALKLLEMGARVEEWHAERAHLLFPREEEKAAWALEVAARRLGEELSASPHSFPYGPMLLKSLLARASREDLFLRLEPLVRPLVRAAFQRGVEEARGWLSSVVVRAVSLSPEALRALRRWGVPLSRFPEAVDLALEEGGEGRLEALRLLLGEGASPEGGGAPLPPLARAALRDDREGVRLLLAHGANPLRRSGKGLHVTAYCRSAETLGLFMDMGVPAEVSRENVEALCGLDPVLAVQLLKETLPKREVWEAEVLARTAFRKIVLEGGEEDLPRHLALFEDLPALRKVPLGGFRGSLEKLSSLFSWAKARGMRLEGGWMTLAVRLGADRGMLLELMEHHGEEESFREAAAAWVHLNPFASEEGRPFLPVLVWLSHEAGSVSLPVWNPEAVRAYLEAGGNPSAQAFCLGSYRPLLHQAVLEGAVDSVALLLEWGAAPDLRDREGNTPLHLLLLPGDRSGRYRAPDERTEQILFLLLSHGADPEARNARGETLKDLVEAAIRESRGYGRRAAELRRRKALKELLRKLEDPAAFARRKMVEDLRTLA